MRKLKAENQIMANWKGDPSQPLVSICCITYNHENYIEDALEGFLIQETDFPFEILINDDASTDKTADIIREYEAKYPKLIKPIYQTENQFSQGISPNWKFNFPRARGKYIALCEGDDYWISTNKLQKQVREVLEVNSQYGFVYSDVLYVDQSNKVITPPLTYQNFKNRNRNGYLFWDLLLNGNFILTVSVVIRKELIEIQHKWFYFDYWLFLDIARKTKFCFINDQIVAYRRHPGGLIISNKSYISDKYKWTILDILDRFLFEEDNIFKNQAKIANHFKISYILTKLIHVFCFKLHMFPLKLRKIIVRKPQLLVGAFLSVLFILIRKIWRLCCERQKAKFFR